jgi:hypothetical protein
MTETLNVNDYVELQVGLTGAAANTAFGGGDALAALLTAECKRILP